MDTAKPIIALDFPNEAYALKFIEHFADEKLFLKVGMELFYSAGPNFVTKLKESGHDVFCDLKLHDIPNTVQRAARSLSTLGADIITVHASGGTAMLKAALDGISVANERPAVVAITQLTSTSEEIMQKEQLVNTSLEKSVINYAQITQNAGLDGVVCSALEAAQITKHTGTDFLKITPGIRFPSYASDDQARVTTPQEAKKNGSSAIVVGRPITQAADPVEAYFEFKKAWNEN